MIKWLLQRRNAAQRLINTHINVLRKLPDKDAHRLADLLAANQFDEASQFVWEMNDIPRRNIPQKTWCFMLSLGAMDNENIQMLQG